MLTYGSDSQIGELRSAIRLYLGSITRLHTAIRKLIRPGLGTLGLRDPGRDFGAPIEIQVLSEMVDGQTSAELGMLPNPRSRGESLMLGSSADIEEWQSNHLGLRYLYPVGSTRRKFLGDPRVARKLWDDQWFPFADASDESNDCYYCMFLDFVPAAGGTKGQVVMETLRVSQAQETAEREVVAPSMTSYFLELAEAALAGQIAFDSAKGLTFPP